MVRLGWIDWDGNPSDGVQFLWMEPTFGKIGSPTARCAVNSGCFD